MPYGKALMIRQSVYFNLLAANFEKYSRKFLGFMDRRAELFPRNG